MISDDLKRISKGEVFDDEWSKLVYSVDASHYSIIPSFVEFPLDVSDIVNLINYCKTKEISITPRGAGSGLLGQSLSNSIVLDMTKHFNKILDVGSNYVIAQPGVTKGLLDRELKKKNKFLPPNPSSSNYCSLGGMISNNASGSHTLGYGSTIDYIEELEIVFHDGSISRITSNDFSNPVISKLYDVMCHYHKYIVNHFPRVSKNSCGYRIDRLIENNEFFPQRIFSAAEGTLGIVTEVKFKVLDIPLFKSLIVFGFKSVKEAAKSIPSILRNNPVALEMLDDSCITPNNLIKREDGCILFIEFNGDNAIKVENSLTICKNDLMTNTKGVFLHEAFDFPSIDRIWMSRKNALNNIMKLTVGSRRPLGLIEDTVVEPSILESYVEFLIEHYNNKRIAYVMYGHMGNGNIHTRPFIDLTSSYEVEKMNKLMDSVFNFVINNGGTISGEHGDGIGRVNYIQKMYGQTIFDIFRNIKTLFDPINLFNPGKKVPL